MDTAHSLQSSVLPPPGLEGFCAHKCDPKKPLKRRRGKRPSPAKVSRDSRRQHKFIGTSLGLPSTTRLAGVIQALVLGATGVLSEDITACLCQGSAKGRRRDVLPLPLLLEWPADVDLMGSKAADALHFAKFCIVSLNVLWSDFKTSRLCRTAPGKPTAPQLEAQKHIAAKTARMLSRFNSASGASWEWQGSFQKFEQAGSARSEPLVGSAVDLPNIGQAPVTRCCMWVQTFRLQSLMPPAFFQMHPRMSSVPFRHLRTTTASTSSLWPGKSPAERCV